MNNDNNSNGIWFVLAFVVVPVVIGIGKFFSPDTFTINSNTNSPIYVRNLSAIDSVQKTMEDEFSMSQNTKAVMGFDNGTQCICELYTTLTGDSGVVFTLRSTRHDYELNPNKGIEFVYSPKGTVLKENGKVVKSFPDITPRLGVAERITFENISNKVNIKVGCTPICSYFTQLPATEYMVVHTQQYTSALLSKITSEPVFEKPASDEAR
ncbi:MAG: hypothetical protein JNJ85_07605 [Candidatus Kapabacteria bacterium]|nr:hypothetical protein [Candidatus Kapabacteria bacterium]